MAKLVRHQDKYGNYLLDSEQILCISGFHVQQWNEPLLAESQGHVNGTTGSVVMPGGHE